jgi:hypothetical protein
VKYTIKADVFSPPDQHSAGFDRFCTWTNYNWNASGPNVMKSGRGMKTKAPVLRKKTGALVKKYFDRLNMF